MGLDEMQLEGGKERCHFYSMDILTLEELVASIPSAGNRGYNSVQVPLA